MTDRKEFKSPDDITAHENEAEKEGVTIKHEGPQFKASFLEMAVKVSKKSFFSDVDIMSINRPAKITSGKSQLQTVLENFTGLGAYIDQMIETDDYIERLRLLLGAIIGNLGDSLLSMTEKLPVMAELGETVHGKYSDGTLGYAEQVNSSPGTTLVHLKNDKYEFFGKIEVY